MIRKILGVICFAISFCFMLFIVIIATVSTKNEDPADDLFVFSLYERFRETTAVYFELMFIFASLAIALLICWAGVKLFMKKKKEDPAAVLITENKTRSKVNLFFIFAIAFSLIMAGMFFYLPHRNAKKLQAEFKTFSSDTIFMLLGEAYDHGVIVHKRTLSDKNNFQQRYRQEVIAEIKSSAEDKTPLMLSFINEDHSELEFERINETDDKGRTALMIALAFGADSKTIETLIKEGASVKAEDDRKRDPLMYAAMFSDDENIIDLLVKNGASLLSSDYDGNYAIHLAAKYNRSVSVTERLIKDRNIVNRSGGEKNNRETPLIIAVRYNNDPGITALLLENGANVNRKARNGNTAINYAVANGNMEIAKQLINAGAYLDRKYYSVLDTAIVYSKDTDMIEMLIEAGAKLEMEDTDFFPNLLIYAAHCANLEIISFFIDKGMDLNEKNIYGMGILEIASVNSNAFEVIGFLKEKGAKEGKVSGEDFPLFVLVSALNYNPAQIEEFISNGADLKQTSSNGYDAFAAACRFNRNPACVEVFLRHGFSFEDADRNGKTYEDHLKENPKKELVRHFYAGTDTKHQGTANG